MESSSCETLESAEVAILFRARGVGTGGWTRLAKFGRRCMVVLRTNLVWWVGGPASGEGVLD